MTVLINNKAQQISIDSGFSVSNITDYSVLVGLVLIAANSGKYL